MLGIHALNHISQGWGTYLLTRAA